ncbi:MAG: D-alanyl-D-alanine carboxypeptidase family protein [Candidatus Omnitrophica bacterium]|nr:D-alanyl-D-alanine carboxypeptidase family protein [Candidatus Omnitrophota bacterium]
MFLLQRSAWLLAACLAGGLLPFAASAFNLQRLEPEEAEVRASILEALEPVIAPKKQDGSAVLLTWEELYTPLTAPQRELLDDFRALRAETLGATSHYFGELPSNPDLASVGQQTISKEAAAKPLDPQYLPRQVLKAYERMMAAMQAEIGRRLFVESGYRSPAYQLYLFLYYMANHDLSVTETNRHVALPGHSEHGAPQRQAIDFINEDGVNGEERPEEFEALPEYAWLQQRAGAYGFALSYPRGNTLNTAFEPWHWHYEPEHDRSTKH